MLLNFQGISPNIAESAFLVSSAEIIGDVTIGAGSSVWFNVVIRGDVNSIWIGSGTNVQDGSVIHVTNKTHPTRIGDDVTIGHRVTLHGCTIGNRCLIGIGAIVLDGAVIGDDCLIAAGALVTPGMLVPPGSLVMGMPAKIKRALDREELGRLKQSARNYTEYIELYRTID